MKQPEHIAQPAATTPAITRWVIKDTDDTQVTIEADHWEVSGNGLVFSLNGERVAHFIRFASYVRRS